jgi:DNA-binding response OmpR family regulator
MPTNAWRSIKAPLISFPSRVTGSACQAAEESGRTLQAHDQCSGRGALTCGKLDLNAKTSRACWKQVDVGFTLGEYNVFHLLASHAGSFVTYRTLYDLLRCEGFMAGTGNHGYRANVRSVIKRIRNKFRACDAAFGEIENYTGFGYC